MPAEMSNMLKVVEMFIKQLSGYESLEWLHVYSIHHYGIDNVIMSFIWVVVI